MVVYFRDASRNFVCQADPCMSHIIWQIAAEIIYYESDTKMAQVGEILPRVTLQWHHYGRDSVSNHQPPDCLLNPLFRRRSKKTPKLRVTGLWVGNSPRTGEFPAQMVSNAENAPFDDVIMRKGHTCFKESVSWLLMRLCHKEPGHPKLRHCHGYIVYIILTKV